MEPENWQSVLDVHLTGAYNVTKPAFAIMRDKGYGRIIMTTSAAGLYGNFGQANYSAAKMGLVGLMNAAKLEGKKYNIKINTIAPLAASRLTEDIMPPELFEKMKPEFVSPMVMYLCSEKCKANGSIYNAGMGFFNRAAVVTGPGATIGDGKMPPSVEQVADKFEKIAILKGGKEYSELNEQVGDLINAFSAPAKSEFAAAPKAASSVADIFKAMPGAFNAGAAKGLDVVFQYNISGSGGGDWFCVIKDGTCAVESGKHEKPTCTLKMADSDFVAMISGTLPAMQAYTSGKLKIEGDVMKSQLIGKLFKL
jgi:putative sterol carrier protein